MYPQAVPLQVAVAFGGTVHAAHEDPQLLTLLLLAHAPPHRWYPALHENPHVPEVQLADAFGGAVHTVGHVPQCVGSLLVLISHPSPGRPLQSP